MMRFSHARWLAGAAIVLAGWILSCPAWAEIPDTTVPPSPAMSLWQSLVLGAVEGFTEYLPVSSTGHLILAQRAMGIGQTEADRRAADAFSICIQAGAILAVLTLYFPYVRRMFNGFLGRDPDGLRLGRNILLAFLPAAVLGFTFHETIKEYLFGLWPIVAAWFVGGMAILIVSWTRDKALAREGLPLEELTWPRALLIGCIQCLAMWPGTSRSLVTIVGGWLVGMKLKSAVIFSFLLGVVTLSAATLHDALVHGRVMVESFGWLNLLAGCAMAAVTAVISVKWLVRYLEQHGLALFGYYRVALAIVVATLISMGFIMDHQ